MYDRYSERARQEWNQVRRKALWTQFWASLRSKKIDMVDFTELLQHFDLGNASYRGVQSIPLDKIVGSVGRYWDFMQSFLPTHQGISERWQRIARLYLDPTSAGVPPIEVYQVGDRYFVDDGNPSYLSRPPTQATDHRCPCLGIPPGAQLSVGSPGRRGQWKSSWGHAHAIGQ